MKKSAVIKLIEDNFVRCKICAAVVMEEDINFHKEWHLELGEYIDG